MGFRIDWSIEEPADAVLTRFYIPLREAHHSVKTNKGSFFVQAPRPIESAAPLVRSQKDRDWKVIYAAWKKTEGPLTYF